MINISGTLKQLYLFLLFFAISYGAVVSEDSDLRLSKQQLEKLRESQQQGRLIQYLHEIGALGARAIGTPGLPKTAEWQ